MFEDEVELKKELDNKGFRYGIGEHSRFVVDFLDNKSGKPISTVVSDSPISAIRNYAQILKETHLPSDDVDIVLVLAFKEDSVEYLNWYLSPYLYYTKTVEKDVDNTKSVDVESK